MKYFIVGQAIFNANGENLEYAVNYGPYATYEIAKNMKKELNSQTMPLLVNLHIRGVYVY